MHLDCHCCQMNSEIHQMDITAAYLNGVLEDDVFMMQPEGCVEKNKEHLVCHLKKNLYGLKPDCLIRLYVEFLPS